MLEISQGKRTKRGLQLGVVGYTSKKRFASAEQWFCAVLWFYHVNSSDDLLFWNVFRIRKASFC
jgi:hypothetical protein